MAVLDAPEAFRFGFIALNMRYIPTVRSLLVRCLGKRVVFGLTLTFRRRHVLHPVDLNGMPPIFVTRGHLGYRAPQK